MYRAADYGLRKPKMLSVSNGNLILLKWQNKRVISDLKFAAIYSKICPSILLYYSRVVFRTT